jgi:hypothetical protein
MAGVLMRPDLILEVVFGATEWTATDQGPKLEQRGKY